MIQGDTPNGGSIHALHIVLEPEAAGIYCLNKVANPEAEKAVFVADACLFWTVFCPRSTLTLLGNFSAL